jgi:hypothetical protein
MDPGAADPLFEGWGQLGWRERRARRFERWLDARGVTFTDDGARRAYRERVQLLIDAIELRKPARVPVTGAVGFFPMDHAGLSRREAMGDCQKAADALVKYHEEFRPDFRARPVASARVFELLGLQCVDWPGHGLPDDAAWQYVEGEYMRADEYDALIADPESYFRRRLLPRFGTAFAGLALPGPLCDLQEAASMPFAILPFADPAVADGIERLAEAARASAAWLRAMSAADADAAGRLGIPPEFGGSVKAPYDILADTLRGTRGIMTDLFRRPEQILKAVERLVPLVIDSGVRQAARADAPLVVLWLHKGADGFLSADGFRTFYWPTLKAVLVGLIEQGIVPLLFVQGSYASRLGVIAADEDLPAGSVIWWFDQTDMRAARRAFAGRACIAGNVPSSLLNFASPREVEQYVVSLLDDCAAEGGFFLRNGASLDEARGENLKAMIDAGRAWRG